MTVDTEVAELDYDSLESAAKDGSLDYEKWPSILEPLLQRLTEIVQTDFPVPTVPGYMKAGQSSTIASESQSPIQSRNEALNTASAARSPRSLPPVPTFDSSATSTATSRVPESEPVTQENIASSSNDTEFPNIPDQLICQLTSIQATLRSAFSEKPPHTIQRLAELIISPNRHYKTLPAWLRAVDRVVSVSSTADIFPLPHAQPLPNSVIDTGLLNGLVNGDTTKTSIGNGGGILWTNATDSRDNSLGSDESLGGALLTPIPWLQNRNFNGDDAEGSLTDSPDLSLLSAASDPDLPTREDGGVTQGELIRMEQEAGIVPVSQGMSSAARIADAEDGDAGMLVDEDAPGTEDVGPHARGPDVVGVEDMGLQDGQGVELQLGRGIGETEITSKLDVGPKQTESISSTSSSSGKAEPNPTELSEDPKPALASETGYTSAREDKDKEGDITLPDADVNDPSTTSTSTSSRNQEVAVPERQKNEAE